MRRVYMAGSVLFVEDRDTYSYDVLIQIFRDIARE